MSQLKLFWNSVIKEKDNEVKILFTFSSVGCLGAKLPLVIISTLIEFTVLSKFSPKQKLENLTCWFSSGCRSPWCWNNLSLLQQGRQKLQNQLLEAFAGITWNETLHCFRCAMFCSMSVQTLKYYYSHSPWLLPCNVSSFL